VDLRPAIFRDNRTGFAVGVNEDGSVNSFSHTAKSGSNVTVYVTGVGPGSESFPDGAFIPSEIYNWGEPVWALTSHRSLEVSFAAYASGMVAGVVQVNFRIPHCRL
jgi:uncharacterized protein (TIGR03437 family)